MMNRNILKPITYRTPGLEIYWSRTLGLISIKEGGKCITIADKNLGATEVFEHPRDEKTEANCGKFYQRGNNYGFSRPPLSESQINNTQKDAMYYGPFYKDDNFIIGYDNWANPHNEFLRDYMSDAKIGPCPQGFHVPTGTEFNDIISKVQSLGIDVSNCIFAREYLKMPFAGYRSHIDSKITNRETFMGYWSCSPYKALYGDDSSIHVLTTGVCPADGFCIRPFKDTPVAPTSSWTILFDGGDGKGIFWDEQTGLISISSDGNNRQTISDKNLGASIVYNESYTMSETNCGKYYQRGNNYGFPFSGDVKTSITQVDARNYGGYYGEYYESNKVFTIPAEAADEYWRIGEGFTNWSMFRNDNLRGGVTGTNYAKRGPCAEGFHVPSYDEIVLLKDTLEPYGIRDAFEMQDLLKLPWFYTVSKGYDFFDFPLHYRTSSACDENSAYAFGLDDNIEITGLGCVLGIFVRPFKNEPVEPDSTRTKLY